MFVGLWRATIAEVSMNKSASPNCWAFGDDVQSFSHYTQQLLDMWPQKLILCGCLSAICQFLYIEPVIFITWFSALLLDFLLGMWISIRVNHDFEWSKWHRGVVKIVSYFVFTLIAAFGGMVINRAISGFAPAIPWIFLLMAAMTVTELKSISRNLECLGFRMPPEIRYLLNAMSRKTKRDLHNLDSTTETKTEDKRDE